MTTHDQHTTDQTSDQTTDPAAGQVTGQEAGRTGDATLTGKDLTREIAWLARRARDISAGSLAGRTPTDAELAEFDRRKAAFFAATGGDTTEDETTIDEDVTPNTPAATPAGGAAPERRSPVEVESVRRGRDLSIHIPDHVLRGPQEQEQVRRYLESVLDPWVSSHATSEATDADEW